MTRVLPAIAAALALGTIGWAATVRSAPVAISHMPAPPAEAAVPAGKAVAIVAGGCFWGMEGVFEHVKGVMQVTSGYAGGTAETANYSTVSTETTNHAEAVRITYDPAQVSYGKLLQIYFSVAHDPTQVDRQYPDSGKSYRSAIFPQTPAQRAIATQYISSLNQAHVYAKPIATRVENGGFYPAEAEHQGFLRRNPDYPYIAEFDMPKIKALHAGFPTLYKN